MKKKHIIYTLSTIPLAITIGNVSDSDAFFRLDTFITKNKTVNDIVNIEDDNLLKAINKQLGRGEVLDSVTVTDMESLTILNAQERNISSIEGLECAINLRDLYLRNNTIQNILPLSNLTNLTDLDLANNQISDISSLGNLINLIHLKLDGNKIVGISSVSNLSNLTMLDLSRNKISDISSLSTLTKLKTLYLGTNKISDLVPISKLRNLNILHLYENQILDIVLLNNLINLKDLRLDGNKISNISSISNLSNLTHLNLANNQISDISSLSNLTNLTHLYLNDNQIIDISSVGNLSNLTTLDLSRSGISDISLLSTLTKLKMLYLGTNKISDLLPISNLVNLNTLHIYENQISDISALSNLVDLKYLHLYGNHISDIVPISNLVNLNELKLYSNKISNISSISNLSNLTHLNLANNQISDISPLSNLSNLNTLCLNDNRISDISSLECLVKLTYLQLGNNQITNISSLRNLSNLNSLYLNSNNISDISILKNISNLTYLNLYGNQISDILPIRNLENLNTLDLSNQKPKIEAGDFKSKANTLDISIKNPVIGLNNILFNITNISDNGVYENGKLKWNNVPLGSHTRTFNFSENVTVGSANTTFGGIVTLNFNVVDGSAPESDHTSEFDSSDFGIYTTVTANDLGTGVDYLIHKGVRHSLPYRFKYDVLEPINNIVEVYDLAGNKAEYHVKLKDNDIPTIEEGLDALVNKDSIENDDISYFRTIINDLDESMNKDLLQDRLNNIYPNTLSLDRKTATSNLDVYIKSENILQMSLDTNSISFDDFSGIEDMEKLNAVNLTINSSLPYQINAYLPAEIQNADKSVTMNKEILQLKESSEADYKEFNNINNKIVLKDNCSSGNQLVHGIDIKLKGGIAHEKDVYKAIIKLEAEQK